ncbi:MAG TPA: VOC family protein [Candidatus Methylomirabilis sp.]|nr:VOC family protein [Candidatus Methylomirabilis sp.]
MDAAQKSGSPFSTLCQVGVIVRNMEEAVRYFEDLGIGPFESSKEPAPIVDRMVRGKPAPEVKNRISTAQLGSVELELVQPVAGESVQREFLEQRGEGINHLGFFVDDLEAETAKLEAKGFHVLSSGKTTAGGAFAYLDTDRIGGIVLELMQRPRRAR